MVKEINSVAEAVPVIMQARGWLQAGRIYYRGAQDTRGRRYLKYSTPERTMADCLSLDVMAEVWAKMPDKNFHFYFMDKQWHVGMGEYYDTYTSSASTLNEAACIATARALVALAATTGSQEDK